MVSLLAVPAATQQQQQVLPPIARYTVDAGTMSGMAAMGGGIGGAMSMMNGGGNRAMHEMLLRLGSTRASTGAASADHFMPAGAQLGKSVPLVTPQPGRSEPGGYEAQTPKGRLLIYWGCGATAPKGQPIVIDFAKVAKGQMPPGLYAPPMSLPGEWEVTPANSRTYGDWPNGKDRKTLSAASSLLGAHKVVSSYAPEINFNLAQDFMPPLSARSAEQPGGSVMLTWNRLAAATGYYAWAFSAKGTGRGQPTDMVWWASSATQAFGGPLWQWLSPAAVQKLIAARTVMPPTQTSCQIPAEVKQAGGEMTMGSLYAYGPELHFANPPRPSDPKVAWKPDWTARVRFRSNTMFMIGMPGMGDMGSAERGEQSEDTPQGDGKPKCKGGLVGIAMRARGLCN
ncbi:hypothetical protein KK488_15740 [Sphingobium sp. H33]|uniref:Uncharacterized protein n=1 Tax=Sphingobium nicotianae TaxID=2782607 RepID=A0A9X1DEE6_9SPHN|nr:hypothetical protein [Sphingobium nicotianae]